MRHQDFLGPDVELTDSALVDPWATNMLKEIGKAITPNEHTYLGSVACHYYRTGTNAVIIDKKVGDVALAQQICLADINEYIAMMGVADLGIKVKQHYGHSHKTTDVKDKRGKT
jgi:hypothetical protein